MTKTSESEKSQVKDNCSSKLRLVCEKRLLDAFCLLLQNGVMLETEAGSTIRALLCNQYNLDPDYVSRRISTVFLDGKPVDDIDSATVWDGSVLALSAALPGFVGAVFRKSGYYAAMRQSITHVEAGREKTGGKATVTVKFYNVLAQELGPHFFQKGVLVKKADLQRFFQSRPDNFRSGCISADVNERHLNWDDLLGIDSPKSDEKISLQIVFK